MLHLIVIGFPAFHIPPPPPKQNDVRVDFSPILHYHEHKSITCIGNGPVFKIQATNMSVYIKCPEYHT